MKILKDDFLKKYHDIIGKDIDSIVENFNFENGDVELKYARDIFAVFSSNIEGNSIDLNSYMNYKNFKLKATKEVKEIDDLVRAYEFANSHKLNEKNLLKSHEILAKEFLIPSKIGKYRDEKVGVFSPKGLVYMAIEPEFVGLKMGELFDDIRMLLQKDLDMIEVFYYSSMIHLVFVHIHPFSDGNGRVARLLEKWFLQEKMGDSFWKIPSEEYYKTHQNAYYENINLGVNFYELDYAKCLSFLKMLPLSIGK